MTSGGQRAYARRHGFLGGHICAGLAVFLLGAVLVVAGVPDAFGLSVVGIAVAALGVALAGIGVIAEGVRLASRGRDQSA